MNRNYAAHDTLPSHGPSGGRGVWRLLFVMLVMFGVGSACGPGDPGRDEGVGTRLTTFDADQLLSSSFSRSQPGSRGLEMLSRPAPMGPPPGEVTIDSLGVDFGAEEAPLRMIEFFDYGCGYCRRFHQETRGPLHEQYVDSGQILWKSIPFVIGRWPASVPISLAAECARDQGRDYFEAISTLIFEHQSDWKSASAPEELAEGFAEEAGLDMGRYRSCFENDELLWRVQAQTAFAEELGVRGTPTFFLVGWGPITGALPLETFQQVIDTVLVEALAGQL